MRTERAFAQLTGDGLVNAGGSLVTRPGAPFAFEIPHPFGGLPLFLECPADTWGLATSSLLKHAWAGGHHLIYPPTARPLELPLAQATDNGPSLTRAEVLTKLAFLSLRPLDALQGDAQVYACDRRRQFWPRVSGTWLAVTAAPPGGSCRAPAVEGAGLHGYSSAPTTSRADQRPLNGTEP